YNIRNASSLHINLYFFKKSNKNKLFLLIRESFNIFYYANILITIRVHIIITVTVSVEIRRCFSCPITTYFLIVILCIITILCCWRYFIWVDIRSVHFFFNRSISGKCLLFL